MSKNSLGRELPEQVGAFCLDRMRRYGRVHLWFYRWREEEQR